MEKDENKLAEIYQGFKPFMNRNSVSREESKQLFEWYNYIADASEWDVGCSSCLSRVVHNLIGWYNDNSKYENYKPTSKEINLPKTKITKLLEKQVIADGKDTQTTINK